MKSGKIMDDHTKGFQKSDKSNTTISYRDSGCGIQAIVTSGGNQYISNSYNTKDEARQEASSMATESLGFRYSKYEEENDEETATSKKIRKEKFEVGDCVTSEFRNSQGIITCKLTFQLKSTFQNGFRDYWNYYHELVDNPKLGITHRHATQGEIDSPHFNTTNII